MSDERMKVTAQWQHDDTHTIWVDGVVVHEQEFCHSLDIVERVVLALGATFEFLEEEPVEDEEEIDD